MTGPACIVCGRAIKKRIVTTWLRSEEQAARHVGGTSYRTVPELPTSAEQVRRLTNAPHITKLYRYSSGEIHGFNTWDGESYQDDFFCTDRCAQRQGYAAAQHGHRYNWRLT